MRFLQLTSRPAVRSLSRPVSLNASYRASIVRPFSIQPARQVKEDHEHHPEELEKKKNEQLRKQKEGKGEWHEGLASAGEANIAADKEQVHDTDKHLEDLQNQTAKQHEKDHPEGKSG